MLLLTLHLFIGATLSGVGIVIALVGGATSGWVLFGVALLGFLLAFPVSWIIAKQMKG